MNSVNCSVSFKAFIKVEGSNNELTNSFVVFEESNFEMWVYIWEMSYILETTQC